MESLSIQTELVVDEPHNSFGNMKFYNNGFNVINTKAIGLYITTLINILSALWLSFLVFSLIKVSQEKLIFYCIFPTSFFYIIFQTFYVSFSNPGFIKPDKNHIECSLNLKALVATIGNDNIFLKNCPTCMIIRDMRVFHCKFCNLCVTRHDHHCPWLSVCIGANNHKKFLLLIFMSIVHCAIMITYLSIIIFSSKQLLIEQVNEINNLNYLNISAIFLFVLTIIVAIMLLIILYFQIKFILTNETTSENIRSRIKKKIFDIGYKNNFREFFSDILGYKRRVVYNSSANNYIYSTKTIIEHFEHLKKRSSMTTNITRTSQISEIDRSFGLVKGEGEFDINKEVSTDTSS